MSVLAIDFGTSRIKAAYWDAERSEAVMLPIGQGGRLYVPSLFYVGKDGKIRFGDDAERELYHDPEGVLDNLKLDLDKAYQYLRENQQVKTSELMTLLLRRIIEHSAREVKGFGGKAPEKLVLTYPAKLDYEDIYRDALKDAKYRGEAVFIREPEAAGWAWVKEENPKPGEVLVVLDFGGGTIDWATLQVDEQRRPLLIPDLRPDGMTAAGLHVDEGLYDEMMRRLGTEARAYAMSNRAQVLEQIRLMKESQNGSAVLSGDSSQPLEVRLGAESFTFERKIFEGVVKRAVLDQAIGRIEGYMQKVVKHQQSGGRKQLWCVLAGGTRLLAGLEEQVKKRIKEIGKASGVEIKFAEIRQADFATVRGAVLWQCHSLDEKPVEERDEVVSPDKSTSRQEKIKPAYLRYLPPVAGIIVVLIAAFFLILPIISAKKVELVEEIAVPAAPPVPSSQTAELFGNFLLIRGGEFRMGSPTYEPERDDDETQHRVKVSDFYMGKYEVTQAEWESVTGTNPSTFKGANLPVENVSWEDCQAFIQALNRKTGKTYRLPTEAEWEYACRAGTITPFSTGGNLTTEQANYDGNNPYNNNRKGQYREKTVAVDSFNPNAWGLYNMHGNVYEWCSDWYGGYESGLAENPAGPTTGSSRVLRGGSWYGGAMHCRSADRGSNTPGRRYGNIAFRLVFVP